MNVSLAAQTESPLLTSLQTSIVSKPFNYILEKNAPLLSKSNITVQPISLPSASVYNSQLVFKIPRYGLLTGIALKVKVLGTAAPTATLTRTTRIGARFFKNVSLRSHNRVIQDGWSEYAESRINNASAEKANAYTNMTTPLPALANSVTSEFYDPIFPYFSERSENALDVAFIEPLELVITVDDRTGMWGSSELLFDMDFVSCELICYYTNLENKTQESLTASQYPLSNPLTQLANDSYREVPVVVTETAGGTVDIELVAKTNNVVTSSHFRVRDKATNSLLPITAVSMISSGQTLVDSTRKSQIFENAFYDSMIANVPGSSSGNDMYSVFYGMSADKTWISGAQAFNGLNAPVFKVSVDTSSLSGSQTFELVCVHDYATILSTSSSDGSIQRSLAN